MKKRVIICLSMVIVALAAIGVGVYFFLFNTPKNIFVKAVNNSINELIEDGKSTLLGNIDYKTLKVTTDTKVDATVSDQKYNVAVTGDFAFDKSNNKMSTALSILGNNQKILDLEALLENSKIYFKIPDLMKTFYFNDLGFDTSKTISKDDIKYLRELALKEFFDSLDNKDFIKSKEKLDLDGNVPTVKLSLELDEQKAKDISIRILEKIKSDEESMKILQKLNKDIKETNIDEALKTIKETKADGGESLIYTIYVAKGDRIVRHEFAPKSKSDSEANKYKVLIDSYKNSDGYKTRKLAAVEDGKDLATFEVKGTSKTDSVITINVAGMVSGEGTLVRKDNEESVSLAISMSGIKLGDIKASIVKDADKKFTCNLAINSNIPGTLNATISSSDKLSFDEALTPVDVTGSKDIKEMTQAEMQIIENTITQRIMKAFPTLVKTASNLNL